MNTGVFFENDLSKKVNGYYSGGAWYLLHIENKGDIENRGRFQCGGF
jgi:hypothetical protein